MLEVSVLLFAVCFVVVSWDLFSMTLSFRIVSGKPWFIKSYQSFPFRSSVSFHDTIIEQTWFMLKLSVKLVEHSLVTSATVPILKWHLFDYLESFNRLFHCCLWQGLLCPLLCKVCYGRDCLRSLLFTYVLNNSTTYIRDPQLSAYTSLNNECISMTKKNETLLHSLIFLM